MDVTFPVLLAQADVYTFAYRTLRSHLAQVCVICGSSLMCGQVMEHYLALHPCDRLVFLQRLLTRPGGGILFLEGRLTCSERKVRKQCHWLNRTCGLDKPLRYHKLKRSLDLVGEKLN